METPKVFESEYRFCLVMWEVEPVSCSDLAKICKERLGWSRTTTYTVIKRLADRGVIKNENSTVSSLITKEEIQISQIDEIMERTFDGSVSAFITAFAKRQKLTEKDIADICNILNRKGD